MHVSLRHRIAIQLPSRNNTEVSNSLQFCSSRLGTVASTCMWHGICMCQGHGNLGLYMYLFACTCEHALKCLQSVTLCTQYLYFHKVDELLITVRYSEACFAGRLCVRRASANTRKCCDGPSLCCSQAGLDRRGACCGIHLPLDHGSVQRPCHDPFRLII